MEKGKYMGKKTMRSHAAAQKQQEKQRRTRRYLGIGLILGAVVLLGVGVYFGVQTQREQARTDQQVQDGSYETVISRYYTAILAADGQTMSQVMAPPAYWTYYLETYDKTEEEVIEDFAAGCENTLEEWRDVYGEDVTLTFQIQGLSEQGQEGLDEWNADMEEMMGSDAMAISEAVTLEVELQFQGSAGSDTQTVYPTLGKIGEGWYILSEDDATLGGDLDAE